MIRWEGCSRFRAVVYPKTLEKIRHKKVNCNGHWCVTVIMYSKIWTFSMDEEISEAFYNLIAWTHPVLKLDFIFLTLWPAVPITWTQPNSLPSVIWYCVHRKSLPLWSICLSWDTYVSGLLFFTQFSLGNNSVPLGFIEAWLSWGEGAVQNHLHSTLRCAALKWLSKGPSLIVMLCWIRPRLTLVGIVSIILLVSKHLIEQGVKQWLYICWVTPMKSLPKNKNNQNTQLL